MELTKQMHDVAKQIYDIHVGSEFEQDPAGWLEYHYDHPERAKQYVSWEKVNAAQVRFGDMQKYNEYRSARIDDMAESLEDVISQTNTKLLDEFDEDDRNRLIEDVATRMFEQLERQMHDICDRIDDMAVSIDDIIAQTPKLVDGYNENDRDRIVEAVASRMFNQLDKQMHDAADKVKAMVAEEPKRRQKREALEL